MRKLLITFWNEPRWLLAGSGVAACALVACGVVLARTLNLAACPLCILQRMLYLMLAFEALLLLTGARRPVALLMAVTAATGAGIAAYQTWLQRFATGLTTCGGSQSWWEQGVAWAGKQMPLLFEASGLCDEAGWVFLGLSIAEWSLLCFIAMTLLALRALFLKKHAT